MFSTMYYGIVRNEVTFSLNVRPLFLNDRMYY